MNAAENARGQPLLVLAVILGSWFAGRALMWEMPGEIEVKRAERSAGRDETSGTSARALSARVAARDGPQGAARLPDKVDTAASRSGRRARPSEARASLAGPPTPPLPSRPNRGTPRAFPSAATAHPEGTLSPRAARPVPAQGQPEPAQFAAADRPLLGMGRRRNDGGLRRWSGDTWLLWREGSGAAVAPGLAAYGRSQAGAVLRYRLDPASAWRPAAYLRATSALQSPRQGELAAGVTLRPVPSVPVVLAAEARVRDTAAGRQVRPAAFMVTELPPATLPFGLRGEAYLQAGYVGGRYETAFVDGQARIDRSMARLGGGEGLRLGLAAWGGAQRDTARLDLGPSATLDLSLGEASVRFAADYRIRVAGDAMPASGPALTFSAGF